MTSSVRIDDLQRKYEENPRRYFAPLASELRRAGEARRAVALCEAGLAADPGHLSGHVVLAQALAEIGDSAGAERAFERAVELDAENLIALRSLGDLARDRGDREAARGWYQHALEADPRDPELATRLSTLDAVPAPGQDVVARAVNTPTVQPPAEPIASAAPPDVVAPAAGLLDEAQAREFQEQRDAEEFTAGFFASLLDAQATPAEPVRVEPPTSEALPVATGVSDNIERPPEVTIAEEVPDVRPDEPEFLDDLMSFDAEGAVERHGAEALAAADERALGDDAATDAVAPEAAAPRWELDHDVASPLADELVEAQVPPAEMAPPVVEQHAIADDGPIDDMPIDDTLAHAAHVDEAPVDEAPVDEGASRLPFVTATMGTLLLQQGFRSDALQIFRQLAAQHPDDADMSARVAELEAELEPSATAGNGVTVANWLRQLAHSRPAASSTPEGDVAASVAPPGAPVATGSAAEGVVATAATDDVDVAVEPIDQPSMTTELSLEEEASDGADVAPVSAPPAAGDAGEETAVADTLAASDLLSSAAAAAAAAASAVTWEASEATPAADDLFFGDDPLDWSQVTAPPPPRESDSVAGLTLDQLLERPVPSADELAAGALAAVTLVMQGDDEVDAQLAEATAEDPAALEHVLAPSPATLPAPSPATVPATVPATRETTSFSFEQFFQPEPSAAGVDAASASRPAAPATNEPEQAPPAGSRDEDAAAREADLADFHAWLAGLSKS